MDRKARNKEGEARSSDEEEAFESADEGEEGTGAGEEPEVVATSADTPQCSTLKESVGRTHPTLKEPAYAGEDANYRTAQCVNNINTGSDHDEGREDEEKSKKASIVSMEDPHAMASEKALGLSKTDENETQSVKEHNESEILSFPKKDGEITAHDEGNKENIVSEGDEPNDEELPRSADDIDNDPKEKPKSTLTPREDDTESKQHMLVHPQLEQAESLSRRVEKIDEHSDRSNEKTVQESSGARQGWGWGGWTSMLTQATASVTSGLSSVIETVETSLGVPDPEEMARKVREEEKIVRESVKGNQQETSDNESNGKSKTATEGGGSFLSGFGMLGLTSMVHTTGIDLVSGGLDALEFIGKKTMDVLAEGDPGLRHKREKLTGKGPSLSQVLKEAKETSEQRAASSGSASDGTTPRIDLFSVFDQYQGVVHLEALEILSRDSEARLESRIIDLTESELAAAKPLLRAVEEVFHIDESEGDDDAAEVGDFVVDIADNVKSLNVSCVPDKIISTRTTAREWIETCVKEQDETTASKDGLEIYSVAVSSIAGLTARTIEFFHKLTELLLLGDDKASEISSLVRSQALRKLTDAVLEEISVLATHFAGCLNTAAGDTENSEWVSSLITTVYLDSSTSASYLRNSLKLLCPVLQLSSLNERKVAKD